jgi:hypothetical protein
VWSLILVLCVENIPEETFSKGSHTLHPAPTLENRIVYNRQKIAVEGKIFALGFSKKYDLSLLSIECWELDRCRAFDRLACVDALLWSLAGSQQPMSTAVHMEHK